MKQRPILMSGPLVRAILDGKKTQTRRPVKHNDITIMLNDNGCDVIYSNYKNIANGKIDFETDSCISERRLYGWERWEDLFKNEIQRIWEEGVRGLVSVKRPSNKKGIFKYILMSQQPESNKVNSSFDLYGISWDAKDYINAGKAFGRKPTKQSTNEFTVGDTPGELVGLDVTWR